MAEGMLFKAVADEEAPGIYVTQLTHSAVESHTHAFYELVYIKSGFCLHETENKTTLLTEGDYFLIKPGQWHRYIGTHTVELYNCLIETGVLEAMLGGALVALPGVKRSKEGESLKLHLDIAEQRRVIRLLNGIIFENEHKETGWEIKIKSHMAELLVFYSRSFEKLTSVRNESSSYPNYVVSALEIIASAYKNPELSVNGIATEVGVTPDYLSRQFKLMTGVCAQEYIRRFRFSKATDLLLGGVSVSDTCKAVGFANLCHFSREFKKEIGVTPTQYVKQNT